MRVSSGLRRDAEARGASTISSEQGQTLTKSRLVEPIIKSEPIVLAGYIPPAFSRMMILYLAENIDGCAHKAIARRVMKRRQA
jgi:hypothetical protein